jgi:preprotein translocase SecE subunit
MADNDESKKTPMPPIPGTTAMKGGAIEFLKDSWIEVYKKTTWPTRPELVRSTSVVLGAIIAVSIYLAAWDLAMTEFTKRVFTH